MTTSKGAPTAIKSGDSSHDEVQPSVAVCAKPRVRDRIFETACDLFYRHGIRAVGVDAIAQDPFDVEAACESIDGTAKAGDPLCEAARASGTPDVGRE